MSQGALCEFWPDEIDKSLVIAYSAFRTKKKDSPAAVGIYFLYHIIFLSDNVKVIILLVIFFFFWGGVPGAWGNEMYVWNILLCKIISCIDQSVQSKYKDCYFRVSLKKTKDVLAIFSCFKYFLKKI